MVRMLTLAGAISLTAWTSVHAQHPVTPLAPGLEIRAWLPADSGTPGGRLEGVILAIDGNNLLVAPRGSRETRILPLDRLEQLEVSWPHRPVPIKTARLALALGTIGGALLGSHLLGGDCLGGACAAAGVAIGGALGGLVSIPLGYGVGVLIERRSWDPYPLPQLVPRAGSRPHESHLGLVVRF